MDVSANFFIHLGCSPTIWFFRAPDNTLQILVGSRRFGRSFGDAEKVRFELLGLVHNVEASLGRPEYYFESQGYTFTDTDFCDVNTAFRNERSGSSS